LDRILLAAISKHTLIHFLFYTNGTERLRITSAGRVGVGTSSPVSGAQLTVAGSALAVTGQNLDHSVNSIRIGQEGSGAAQIRCYGPNTSTNGSLTFKMSRSDGTNSQDVVIDGSGRLGVGTTSPDVELHIHSTSDNAALEITRGAVGSEYGYALYGSAGATDAALRFFTIENGLGTGEKMRLDASGRLGIGTSSPSGFIHIQGTSTGTETYGRFTTGSLSGDQSLVIKSGASRDHMAIQVSNNAGTADDLALQPDGGRVGIGTTSPGANLQVTATGSASEVFVNSDISTSALASRIALGNSVSTARVTIGLLGGGGETAFLGTEGNFPIYFQTNGTERARIDSSGRLLVGTSTSPSLTNGQYAKAHFVGNTFTATGDASLNLGRGVLASSGIAANTSLGSLHFTDSAGAIHATINGATDAVTGSNDYPGRLVFSTTADGAASPTERMRINNAGYTLLFGDNVLNLASSASAGTSAVLIDASYSATAVGTGTRSFIVYNNGNVLNTNNSYGSLSDVKLKENIIDAASQWSDIKALQVRNYNFKEGQTHTQIGLVAQEVELVSPGLVSESPDRDEDGNDLGTVTKSVNYSVLYMKAVKALQEAIAKIETLEGMVAVNNITIDEQQHQLSTLAARLTALESA
jgi:hypothetical protein